MTSKNRSESWTVAAGLISILIAANACGQSTKLFPGPAIQNQWPITKQSILAAMANFFRQPDFGKRGGDGAELQWYATPVAQEENAQLEVSGVYADLRRSAANLHLRCIRRQACGDFWIALDVSPDIIKQWRSERCRTTGVELGSLLFDHDSEHAKIGSSADPMLIQAGRQATVTIQEPNMQITLLVRCLEGGRLQQVIRVYDPNSHRVLRAEVVGVDRLRARWQ